MIVAGVMSGTSADGINVALINIAGRGFRTRFRLLAHYEFPFPPAVRKTILELMNATHASVSDLSQLNFLLGKLYADAVVKAVGGEARKRPAVANRSAKPSPQLDLVGCHGQTIYHQGEPTQYLGHRIASTCQTGEGAVN